MTPLHLTTRHKSPKCLALLLKFMAPGEVDTQDKNKVTDCQSRGQAEQKASTLFFDVTPQGRRPQLPLVHGRTIPNLHLPQKRISLKLCPASNHSVVGSIVFSHLGKLRLKKIKILPKIQVPGQNVNPGLPDSNSLSDCQSWQLPTHSSVPGEPQGRGSLVGCCLWGRSESDTTEVAQQQQQHDSGNLL